MEILSPEETKKLDTVILLEQQRWTQPQNWEALNIQIITLLEDILLHNPACSPALVNLGAIYSDQGDYIKALKLFEKARQLGYEERNLYMNLGYVSIYLQKPESEYAGYFNSAKNKEASSHTFEAYFDPHSH